MCALFMVFLLDSKGAKVLLAFSEQNALGTFSSLVLPGLAALLRSAGFFSGAVCFVRMTLARSAFLGFQIGFQRCKSGCRLPDAFFIVFRLESLDSKGAKACKSCRSRQELSYEYLLLVVSIYLQNLASIQPRTGLSKFAKN